MGGEQPADEPKVVLVIDDDPELRRILVKRLGTLGYQILEAEDGETGLARVVATPPDLVILDVMMPGMTGWEVARELKQNEQTCAIPILMLTAIGASMNQMTSPLYGADDHLDKPFDLTDLEAKVSALLAG